jgi:fused signal recognition particle receptor
MSLLDRFRKGLKKTSESVTGRIAGVLSIHKTLDKDTLDELEEILISSDLGVATTEELLASVAEQFRKNGSDSLEILRDELKTLVGGDSTESPNVAVQKPRVILLVGVNGSGKTTTAAKLAYRYRQEGKYVMIAACDTFRAAAVEQLQVWAERVGADLVKQETGADAASVAYDALSAARARGSDVLLVDTAGRLHTKANLMNELDKITRVLKKKMPDAPHEVLLVLDATTGQNALVQAREFHRTSSVTGLVLTKLDGTSKGGIVLAIHREHAIPVKYIGIGEQPEDLEPFQADTFVDALLTR